MLGRKRRDFIKEKNVKNVYDRIDGPSNQGMEGSNHDLNSADAITASYAKKTTETWIQGTRFLEKQANLRKKSLKRGHSPKQKQPKLLARDQGFITARNRHKRMKYSKIEKENDRLYLERCKTLMKLSKFDTF